MRGGGNERKGVAEGGREWEEGSGRKVRRE